MTIPNSVTSIDEGVFYGCSSLTSVTIPNSVTSIGANAFRGCKGITSVSIGSSVESIGKYTFYGCSGLTSVTIPYSVTSIGVGAFYDCTGLTSVIVRNPVPVSISSSTFTNRMNATLYVPIGSKTAYESANYWKEFKEIVEEATSGINQVETKELVDVYTVDGQKIRSKVTDTNDLPTGVYIIRGKKVLVQ